VSPGTPLAFNAAASSDPDGQIASYAWSFGDGQTASGGPTQSHTYGAAGTYPASLTLTDNEGCSTSLLFTGATASCNGSPLAVATRTVTVAPGRTAGLLRVRVSCTKRAKPGGCKIELQIVSGKPRKTKGHKKGKAEKPKPESAVAKVKLNAGHSALVTLRPQPKFATRLAAATKLLVREVETVKGVTHTSYRRLKVVR
jgi:hypothetical protein